MGECCFCGKKLSSWKFGYPQGSLYDSEGWQFGPREAVFRDLTKKSNVTESDKRLTKFWLCKDCRTDYLNLLGLSGEVTETKTTYDVLYETKPLHDFSIRREAADRILEKTDCLTKLDMFPGQHVHKLINKLESEYECVQKWEYMTDALQSYWQKFGDEHPEAMKNQIHIYNPGRQTIDWTKINFSPEEDGIYQTRWMSRDDKYLYMTMFFPKLVHSVKYSYELRPDFEEDVNTLYQTYFLNGQGEPELVQKIALDDIVFFYKDGDVRFTTETHGGGGRSINVGGAVKGAILAGAVGAYIGGQKGVSSDPIYTTTQKHDDRRVILRMKGENHGMRELVFKKEMYEQFMTLIPEKEITNINCQTAPKVEETISDPIEKIKGLKSLLDLGAITQEEFDEKKKQLLNSI